VPHNEWQEVFLQPARGDFADLLIDGNVGGPWFGIG